MGDFAPAQTHFDQGLALYDFERHRSQAFLSGFDPGMLCITDAALALWFRGYPDQARKRIHEALRLAQGLSHPESLVLAQHWPAMFHQFCREEYQALQRAEAAKNLAVEHGLVLFEAIATPLLGWALAQRGRDEEGIAQMREGLTALRAFGEYHRPYDLALLAEGYRQVGQVEEGLDALAEALALVNKNEERWYEAELYRLKGELSLQSRSPKSEVEESSESGVKTGLGQVQDKSKTSQDKPSVSDPRPLAPGPQVEAEACFLKAVKIAQRQQARSWELRAVTSLARLWQQQGKQHAARNMLSEIYNWFTEGFDTKDLQEAKALLETLQSESSESKTV
jgi:adenylate cyclase